MAINVDAAKLPEKGGDSNPETKFIRAGQRPARLVSYVELGMHHRIFQGQRAKFDKGKMAGKDKPPVLFVGLTFEFPKEPYTGDYPLTIDTSVNMKDGEFFNAVVVPESLADGTMARAYAMKTKFMKYLTSLQAATGQKWSSIAKFAEAQVPLLVSVRNKVVEKEGETRTYANMVPEGITAPVIEDPMTGERKDYSKDIPKPIGDYCKVYDWDAPTEEGWKLLPPWHKRAIKSALNFPGSPTEMMLLNNPDLEEVLDGGAQAEDHDAPVDPGDMPV